METPAPLHQPAPIPGVGTPHAVARLEASTNLSDGTVPGSMPSNANGLVEFADADHLPHRYDRLRHP